MVSGPTPPAVALAGCGNSHPRACCLFAAGGSGLTNTVMLVSSMTGNGFTPPSTTNTRSTDFRRQKPPDQPSTICGYPHLVEHTITGATPLLRVNLGQVGTALDEQLGAVNLAKGMFRAFRIPVAHELMLHRTAGEIDAHDVLETLPMIHRRLDVACSLESAR
jgi:hypothetical protein